ncbi:hypothetical protein BT96DRAFT_820124, partial [Gymnopus androsaceus JB14]
IFEDRLHSLLQDGHPWDVYPMVQLSAESNMMTSNTDPVYLTKSISLAQTFHLHTPHLQPLDVPHSPCSLHLCIFDNEGLSHEQVRSGVYFRPRSPVQATFDSFICDPAEKKIYIFKFTVSVKHSVKHSGLAMLAELCPDFKMVYIGFTPNATLKLPFEKQSESLVVEKWHAVVSSDKLFAVSTTFQCLMCSLAYILDLVRWRQLVPMKVVKFVQCSKNSI